MRKKYVYFAVLGAVITTFIGCEAEPKKEVQPVISVNLFKQFSNNELQVFDLDTLSYKEIIGKDGTEIEFYRENFEVPDGQKLTLELREFYDFKELLYNNIQTVTDKGELLASSGVLYISVKANGEEVYLKEGAALALVLPYGKLTNNKMYIGEVDNSNDFLWKEEAVFISQVVYDPIYKIDILVEHPLDSLDYYIKKAVTEQKRDELILDNEYTFQTSLSKLNWINIDRVVEPDKYLDFNLQPISEDENLIAFEVYFIYKEMNSFIHDFRFDDNLRFTNIPIKNETYMVVTGQTHEGNYGGRIKISNLKDYEVVKLKMKKIDPTGLKKLLEF